MRIIRKPPLSTFRAGKLHEQALPSGVMFQVHLTMQGRKRLWKVDPPMDSLSALDKVFINKVVMPRVLMKYKYVEDRLFSRNPHKVIRSTPAPTPIGDPDGRD